MKLSRENVVGVDMSQEVLSDSCFPLYAWISKCMWEGNRSICSCTWMHMFVYACRGQNSSRVSSSQTFSVDFSLFVCFFEIGSLIEQKWADRATLPSLRLEAAFGVCLLRTGITDTVCCACLFWGFWSSEHSLLLVLSFSFILMLVLS